MASIAIMWAATAAGSRPLLSTDQPSLGQCVSVSLIESGDLSWAQSLHVGGHRR